MSTAKQFQQAERELMKQFGEPLDRERDGVATPVVGRRDGKNRTIVLPHDADIQPGDVLVSPAANMRFTVTDVDPHVIQGLVIAIQVHYETATQQAQRLAAEQARQPAVTIGDISNSVVTIASQLSNVFQMIGTIPGADQSTKDELTALTKQLNALLQQAPIEHADDVERITERVEGLVKEAKKSKPDPDYLKVSAAGLKKAAANLATVLPAVIPIATQLADQLLKAAHH